MKAHVNTAAELLLFVTSTHPPPPPPPASEPVSFPFATGARGGAVAKLLVSRFFNVLMQDWKGLVICRNMLHA